MMIKEDARKMLWELDFTAGMSQNYYRTLTFALGAADRLMKLFLGLAAIWTLALEYRDHSHDSKTFWLAASVAIVAAVLNIAPFDSWERRFQELKVRWKDFQNDARELQLELFGVVIDPRFIARTYETLSDEVPDGIEHDIRKLIAKKHNIDVDEDFDWAWLNNRSKAEESRRRWGKECDTSEKISAEFARLRAEYADKANANEHAAAS